MSVLRVISDLCKLSVSSSDNIPSSLSGDNAMGERRPLLVAMKWGGELTQAGREQVYFFTDIFQL